MSKRILIALCLLSALLLACGKSESTAPEANSSRTTNANTTAAPPTDDAASTSTTASAEKIGVPECDEFLAKYEACVTGKVPAASRQQFQTSLTEWRTSWKRLAANPQGKAVLEAACKNANEQARTSMKAYNCTF